MRLRGLRFPELDRLTKNYLGDRLIDALHHVLGGSAKAFFTYWLPFTILRRRLRGNFQRAFACGAAVGVVRLCDRMLQEYAPKEEATTFGWIQKYRLVIAGAVGSSVGILVDTSLSRSTVIVFWCLIRALRCYTPDIPYGSSALMCFCASVILSAYLVDPHELDPGYIKFINRQSHRAPETVRALTKTDAQPCELIHPGKTCVEDKLALFPINLLTAVKIYIPLYLVFFAFSKKRNVAHLVLNIARSSMFLSTCAFFSWCIVCVLSKFQLPLTRTTIASTLWISGLSALFERESRRKELATYSLTYAIESLYQRALSRNLLITHPLINWFFISMCCGVLLHNHHQQPSYVMRWFFKISSGHKAR